MSVGMAAMAGMCSMAVDLGRVQLAKTELRRAADSAGRAAAAQLPDTRTATAFANQYVQKNLVDGTATTFDSTQDIEFGHWDTNSATFTKLSGFAVNNANCVHITLRRTAARGNAVPLLFAKVLGPSMCDVHAESYVMLIPAIDVDQNVLGISNPFLSGAATGTLASQINPSPRKIPDVAGTASNPLNAPSTVTMAINDSDAFTFDSIAGTVRHDPNLDYYQPDGDLDDIGHNNLTTTYANNYGTGANNSSKTFNENGIADVTAPINALVGVFLDDSDPNSSAAPTNLDYSTDAMRNKESYTPQLKQIFFIGDGQTDSGVTQQFIAPKGATRLYLATWDFYEWNNNAGSREVIVKRPQKIITVK